MTTLRPAGHRHDNADAYLSCSCSRHFTLHRYEGEKRLGHGNGNAHSVVSAYEQVYACGNCGNRRRWGLNAGPEIQ